MNEKCNSCNYLQKCPDKVEYGSVWCLCHREIPKIRTECLYCKGDNNSVRGKIIYTDEFEQTHGYSVRLGIREKEYLHAYILKGKEDKYAGFMIENQTGARYINIKYCPFCGRKLSEEIEQ